MMKHPPTSTKRPSRKHRRRPRNLLEEYNRRQRKHQWLETHIWHAKRFHMVEKWGYKLALHPNDKGARASYRASRHHCLIQVLQNMKCSRAWNVREFRGFANFSCTWTVSQLTSLKKVTKMGVIFLKMVRFSIRNHRWKALEVYNPEISRISMHANCLWTKFANFSCREHFMFYSTLY